MPIYIYETLGKNPRRFEMKQGMNDAALTKDPETGEPVHRVITGGYGLIEKKKSTPSPARTITRGGHSCGSGSCGCH